MTFSAFQGVYGMVNAVEGSVVYQTATGQYVLSDHFSFVSDVNNFMVRTGGP
mgnify:FL=1